jgi:hypothetical protein
VVSGPLSVVSGRKRWAATGETEDVDDRIARHALDRGHWPGLTLDELLERIREVREESQEAYDFGGGRRIHRKGDTVLVEDGTGGGTIFQPSPSSATRYFRNFVRRELGR